MLNLYITSPSHSDGKTFVSAGLAATMQSLGYKTTVYKPIQIGGKEINGFMQAPDLTFIKTIDPYIDTKFSYLFKENSEPLLASENENVPIDIDVISKDFFRTQACNDCMILDGISGLMTPLAPQIYNWHLIKKLNTPVLFVITPGENSVNDILSSVFIAQEHILKINGVIINNIDDNIQNLKLVSLIRIIEEYTNIKVLGMLPSMKKNIEPENLITNILNGVDIESVFGIKIEKLEFN